MANSGLAQSGTDTEYLRDQAAPGPITQHGAEGMSPGGPVHRPNPHPWEVGLPARLLTTEIMGFPAQVWFGLVAWLFVVFLVYVKG